MFDRSGKHEDPATSPKECDACQYTEGTAEFPGFWDTVHDAQNIYNILRSQSIAAAWGKLWKDFTCPPEGKSCNFREACSAKPSYIEGFAVLVKAKDGNKRWKTFVTVGRKIRCIEKGPEKDVPIEIPDVQEPKDEEPPKKPAKEKPSDDH